LNVSVFLLNIPWKRPIVLVSFCRMSQFCFCSPMITRKPSFS